MNIADSKSIKVKLTLAVMIILTGFTAALAENLKGRPRVIDGDTIIVRKTRIWLYGIDAPEYKQKCHSDGRAWPCGRAAKTVLKQAIGTKRVTCATMPMKAPTRIEKSGLILATCRAGKLNLNEWMVKNGYAMAFRLHGADYAEAERTAKQKHLGIWNGTFIKPSEWRRQNSK